MAPKVLLNYRPEQSGSNEEAKTRFRFVDVSHGMNQA